MKTDALPITEYLKEKEKMLPYIILVIPVILYFNTLFNDYALDDSIVITDNIFVKKGLAGIKDIFRNETFTGFFKHKKNLVQGGRYRPLSVATFAVEYSVWGMRPRLSHLINILLYSLLCLVLFRTLSKILFFLDAGQISIPVAFLATVIFAVHPVHTEVVANIKGRDELLAVLFMLLSLLFFIRCIEKPSLKIALSAGAMLLTALLSKENAMTVIAIGILLLLMRDRKVQVAGGLLGLISLMVAAIVYLVIRMKIAGGLFTGIESGELMNNPFLHADSHQKSATIFYTLLLYIKLLIFPHPLTYQQSLSQSITRIL